MICIKGTPLEHYPELGLWVKREDLCCPEGPNFSKVRGVEAHIIARPEHTIGVLDTAHSMGGHAVARACHELGKACFVFYPIRKMDWLQKSPLKPQQQAAKDLGATVLGLEAGRSAVLYHRARKWLSTTPDSYMMPNALRLPEMVEETTLEFARTPIPLSIRHILVSASSGTIAAGVIRGIDHFASHTPDPIHITVHLGYSRPESAVRTYLSRMSGITDLSHITIVDEGYTYSDVARPGPTPPFPCNPHYDLKAYRYLMTHQDQFQPGELLLWNIG